MIVEVNNQTHCFVPKKKAVSLLKFAARRLKVRKKKLTVSVGFVSKKKIKELNQNYRGKNKATDVLSFVLDGAEAEIIVCPSKAKEQARAAGHSFQKEILILILHGFLHILGFDHEKSAAEAKKMEKIEKELIKNFSTGL